jgi:hypothetical protein
MDINAFTSEEEIRKKVKTKIKRAVKSMHKACKELYLIWTSIELG